MRQSKTKNIVVKGSLRGLNSQEYYTITGLKNPVAKAKRWMTNSLFTKFDRRKPLNDRQVNEVEAALNRTVFDQMKSLIPFTTPIVRLSLEYQTSKTKAVYSLLGVEIFRLPKIHVGDGYGYLACGQTITHDGHEGEVLYSNHAIDRLLERSDLMDFAATDTTIVLRAMQTAVKDAKIELGIIGPQLKIGPLGYLPMVWKESKNMWMLTTFLEKDMKGSAKDAKKATKQAWEELSQKYEVDIANSPWQE